MPSLHLSLAFALALALFAPATALTFDLLYGSRKCVSEDLPPGAEVKGELHVSGGSGDMSLDLFVSDPRGVVYFHRAAVNSVKYSFTSGSFDANAQQTYRFCVVHQVHPNSAARTDVSRRVSLDVKVDSASVKEDMKLLASKSDVSRVSDKFQGLYQEVDELIGRMEVLRKAEAALSVANAETSRIVLRVTVIAGVFTVLTGVLNFVSLKSFFKSKKLA